jgi:uncharacterized protein YcgI (DUF1989 family)
MSSLGFALTIPARHGRAFEVSAGSTLTIIDVEGEQVADMSALVRADFTEFLSPRHTRLALGRLTLRVGDELQTNRRRPHLRLLDDSVGVHDILLGCCDRYRYELDFHVQGHRNCMDNLTEALAPYGVEPWRVPENINIFMNTIIEPDGRVHVERPVSRAGDHVTFECLIDSVIAISACPQDLNPCNGFRPTDLHVRVAPRA